MAGSINLLTLFLYRTTAAFEIPVVNLRTSTNDRLWSSGLTARVAALAAAGPCENSTAIGSFGSRLQRLQPRPQGQQRPLRIFGGLDVHHPARNSGGPANGDRLVGCPQAHPKRWLGCRH